MNWMLDLAGTDDSAYTFATQYGQATKADVARTVVAESGGQQDKRGLQLKEKEDVFFLLAGNFALVKAVQILV